MPERRLLVVHDYDGARLAITQAAVRHGNFKCEAVDNFKDAHAKRIEFNPHVVVVDWQFQPEKDQTINLLRTNPGGLSVVKRNYMIDRLREGGSQLMRRLRTHAKSLDPWEADLKKYLRDIGQNGITLAESFLSTDHDLKVVLMSNANPDEVKAAARPLLRNFGDRLIVAPPGSMKNPEFYENLRRIVG
jgi:DNA-binding NarL/FixJ family response regulator